jgi:glycosyltransferase involved in cell wall biosynthesis
MGRHRVCLVVGQLDIGGLEKQVYFLATALDPQLFDVTVVSLAEGGVWKGALAAAGVRVVELCRRGHMDWRRLLALRRIFRTLQPDLVYSFNYAGNVYARLAGLLARVPILVTGERDIYMTRSMGMVERALLPITECVICNAEAIRRDLVDRVGLPGKKVVTIPNAVIIPLETGSGEREVARRLIGAGRGDVVVGTISRIDAKKNLGMMVRAAALCLPGTLDLRFCIVGGGPDEKALRGVIGQQRMDRHITLVGPREDAQTLLPGFDIFVLTSRAEGLPNTVMEAMAAGLPCICTDVGGCRELVSDGVTGYLVPSDDERALAKRILDLVANPAARVSMGRRGKDRVGTDYTVERLASRVQTIFLHLLSNAGSKGRGHRLAAEMIEAMQSPMKTSPLQTLGGPLS